MSKLRSFQVAGVDGCKAGWLIAVVSGMEVGSETDKACVYKLHDFWVAGAFGEILSIAEQFELICVDIPIGLSDGPPRECDLAARRILSPFRASSVFPAPARTCLSAKDYSAANAVSRRICGKGLSKQSFALLDKIREVDELVTPALQNRVREIHPEVSFWALNEKKPIEQNKKTVPGQARRRELLGSIFAGMDSVLAKAPTRGCVMDDALDALVAAWTAGQTVIGKATTLPENPLLDSKGLRMEILCPAKQM